MLTKGQRMVLVLPLPERRDFLLAAIMYVDDTDLLHWAPNSRCTVEKLIEQVQEETTQWGMLAQSTGGILKAPKCSNYIIYTVFDRGAPRLMSLEDFPEPSAYVLDKGGVEKPTYVTIPQPDGSKWHI